MVDGEPVEVANDSTILHALAGAGLELPSLCDDGRLAPYGECRMCLVRIDGHPQPVAACTTGVESGMVIETAPADLESARREVLGMLACHYPADAVADAPDTPFHRLLRRYEVEATGRSDADRCDDSHPCIAMDMNRCIDCFRCVRICDEVQGQFAWQIAGLPADADEVTVLVALDHYLGFFGEMLTEIGWGALDVLVGGEARHLGAPGHHQARLRAQPFELAAMRLREAFSPSDSCARLGR